MKKMIVVCLAVLSFSLVFAAASNRDEEDALIPVASAAVKKRVVRWRIGYETVSLMGMFPEGFSAEEKMIIRYWQKDPNNLRKLVGYARKHKWPQEYIDALRALRAIVLPANDNGSGQEQIVQNKKRACVLQ